MAYFYTDANGKRRGPVNNQQLQALASQGVIQPTTILESESGKTGAARQLTGLTFGEPVNADTGPVPPPAPKQLYCTNCGNATSEQAVACMACGAKPIGHKKFCRQCGIQLNPEQVVCVKCGASVAAPIMPDAKRILQSVLSSSSPFIEKIKVLPKPAIIAGIAIVVIAGILCLTYSSGSDNPSTVVRKFDAALKSGNKKTQGQLATSETVGILSLFGEKVENSAKMSGKIKSCNHTFIGDTAVVHVIWENGKPEDISMKKIDGKWKIHLEMPSLTEPPSPRR